MQVVSACKKQAERTKPWIAGTKSHVDFGKPIKLLRSEGTRNLGTSGRFFKLQLEDPTRYQPVNRARINYQSVQRVTAQARDSSA